MGKFADLNEIAGDEDGLREIRLAERLGFRVHRGECENEVGYRANVEFVANVVCSLKNEFRVDFSNIFESIDKDVSALIRQCIIFGFFKQRGRNDGKEVFFWILPLLTRCTIEEKLKLFRKH